MVSDLICEIIVFCGVYFMVEIVDILVNCLEKFVEWEGKLVMVILFDMFVGCLMVDMVVID